MDELDVVWDRDRAAADRILKQYGAMGATALVTGPIVARGYAVYGKPAYPDANWIGRADDFARFLDWARSSLEEVVLFALPDLSPWMLDRDSRNERYDWDRVRADLDPVYRVIASRHLVTRVVLNWERVQSMDHLADGFNWLAGMFPDIRRGWHNARGHLWAGLPDEDQQAAARSMADHGIHDAYVQVQPPDGKVDRYTEMIRTLDDMRKRFNGEPGSPWGTPVMAADGQPVQVIAAELTAQPNHEARIGQDEVSRWARGALSVRGIVHCLDGIPDAA